MKSAVPSRFADKRLSDYDTELGDIRILEDVSQFVDVFEDHRKTGRGLLLVGPPGRGKSLVSCIVLNELADRGHNSYYTTYAHYLKRTTAMIELRQAWEKMQDQEAYDEWYDIRRTLKAMRNDVHVLAVDDVGKEHLTKTKHAEDELDFLLRYRFDRALPTVISTNATVPEWGDRYGASMESFVYEAFIIIEFTGSEDVRRTTLRRLR